MALVGTIREQNPTINFDGGGIQNFGFYRDDDENELNTPVASVLAAPPSSSPHSNWIELRPSLTNNFINTAQLSPADYEIRSHPTDDYVYIHQSPPPRPTIIDLHQYRNPYRDSDHYKGDDDELENFQFQSLQRSDIPLSYIQRTDTSTESFSGNTLTFLPKSILKSSVSMTPPIDLVSNQYPQVNRSRTSSKFDESSPRISVKINTDESIPIDYPTSAIEELIPIDSIFSTTVPTLSMLSSDRMRFASVSQLNEVEWEVPSEFHTIYDSIADRQTSRVPVIYSSNRNLNNSNNNYDSNNYDEKLSNRQRSQSASVDQRKHISRIYVPWDREKKTIQPHYLSNDIEHVDTTQQKAFEY